jgi:PIN domain nuclease of toxin-antitoxin system
VNGRGCVLDASALLALLYGEPGRERVEALLEDAVISAVNWSEAVQKALADGVELGGMRADLTEAGVEVRPFDTDAAEEAAALWPAVRSAGLGLADRACLALALKLGVPAVTADRSWASLDLDVDIVTIR